MLKKVYFMVLLLCLFAVPVLALEWVNTNQATVTWDAVTTLSDGTAIPEDNLVEYAVYSVEATDVDKENPVELGITPELTYTITMHEEAEVLIGLRTLRRLADSTLVSQSVIGWSDDPSAVADKRIFGIRFYLSPERVRGLQPQ